MHGVCKGGRGPERAAPGHRPLLIKCPSPNPASMIPSSGSSQGVQALSFWLQKKAHLCVVSAACWLDLTLHLSRNG